MSMDNSTPGEERGLLEESRSIWDTNASAWDARMAAGSSWQTMLIAPAVERLLALKPGETVLDMACGNGIFSRRMAELGTYVVASDFSPKLIELARARTTEHADRIEYHVADATCEGQLLALGERRFDAAVCNMALMDMPVIEPLYRALSRMLKPNAPFVFSVMHPCFNGNRVTMLIERSDYDNEATYAIKVSNYLNPGVTKGLAISEQPVEQYYWHRPLNVLLNAAFSAGFVMDALEEPPFIRDTAPNNCFDWANFDMPPVLFVRMLLPGDSK